MHGLNPLHVCKGEGHLCKIREPRDVKRWTLVEIGYDLGTRAALRAALVPDRLVIVNDRNQRPLGHSDLPMGS